MTDYIDRNVAIEKMKALSERGTVSVVNADEIIAQLSRLPSVNAKPVKYGLWQIIDRYSFTFLRCSVCGEELTLDDNMEKPLSNGYNFCPYCGAEMISEVIADE